MKNPVNVKQVRKEEYVGSRGEAELSSIMRCKCGSAQPQNSPTHKQISLRSFDQLLVNPIALLWNTRNIYIRSNLCC